MVDLWGTDTITIDVGSVARSIGYVTTQGAVSACVQVLGLGRRDPTLWLTG